MKLISLNTWGGKIYGPLMDFIKQEAEDTDIFCFQEVLDNSNFIKKEGQHKADLLNQLINILPDFAAYFSPIFLNYTLSAKRVDYGLRFGLATFVSRKYQVIDNKNFEVVPKRFTERLRKDFLNIPSVVQQTSIVINNKKLTLFNFHGIPMPGDKLDTPKRIKQTKKIINIINKQNSPKVLVGDFNL